MRPLAYPLVAVLLAGALFVPSAHAQMTVYDPAAVAKLISQAQTELQQLQQLKTQVSQGQTLLSSLNTASNINTLASQLASPALRAFLPDAQTYVSGGQGNLTALGSLGASASSIRAANRIYTPAANNPLGQDLETSGNQAALDLALGEQVSNVSASRLQGLQQLQTAIGSASDARAVLDLQARLAAEQAMIANDQMRLQGLAMAQAAQDRLQQQRDRERAAQLHSDAEATFRSMIQ